MTTKMKKSLKIIFTSIFSLIFLVSLISADIDFIPSEITKTITSGNTSVVLNFVLNHTGIGGDYTNLQWNANSTQGTWSSLPSLTRLNSSDNESLSATLSSIPADFVGTIYGDIQVNNSGSPKEDLLVTINVLARPSPECDEFCTVCTAAGNPGELDVTNLDISVKKGFGDDDNYWYPFDEVELNFDVRNRGDYDIQDAEIEICLWDKDANECVMDERDMDLSDDRVDVDRRDRTEITATFTVDPDKLREGNTDYILYIRALGQIRDRDAGVLDRNDTCAINPQDMEIRTDEDFVIIRNFDFPQTVKRGETVDVTADIWNIGDRKIKSKDLFVLVESKTLGFSKVLDLDDLRSFNSNKISFSFTVPKDAIEKTYGVKLTAYDDKDLDDKHIYENSENDEAIYDFFINVMGGKDIADTTSVSASLETTAIAGEKATASITIANTGDTLESYAISVAGYDDWASSSSLSKTAMVVAAGNTDTSNVTFQIKDDVSGEKTFEINLMSDGKTVLTQPVTISIQKNSGFSFSKIFGDNWYLWLIGIINVVLIIIIIVVAIKIARS